MQPNFINIFWQVLLVIAVIALFSFIVLSIALYIQTGRKDERKSCGRHTGPTTRKQSKIPDIMGSSRQPERQSQPIEATERQNENREDKPVTFAREIPSEELDQVFGTEQTGETDTREDPDPDEDGVDWQEEETELQAHRTTADNENDFATGVSFDELQQVTNLIQKDKLRPDEQKSVITAAVKLAHTDLWEKIMKALPDANEKIAKMLDASPQKVQTAEDWRSFDIRNFI